MTEGHVGHFALVIVKVESKVQTTEQRRERGEEMSLEALLGRFLLQRPELSALSSLPHISVLVYGAQSPSSAAAMVAPLTRGGRVSVTLWAEGPWRDDAAALPPRPFESSATTTATTSKTSTTTPTDHEAKLKYERVPDGQWTLIVYTLRALEASSEASFR